MNVQVICGSVISLSPFALAELHYHFTGFFQPVDNPGGTHVVNVAKAGTAIPVRFSLGGDLGLNVLPSGSPSLKTITCGSGPTDAIEGTVNVKQSGLRYDPVSHQYIYSWKTVKTWKGTCAGSP